MTNQTQYAQREQRRKATSPRQEPGRDWPRPVAEKAERLDLLTLQRAVLDPAQAAPAHILQLQRTVGNQAVSRLIQTKLTVGPAGDRYEQEADRVADQVMTMPAPISQSRAASGGQSSVQRVEEEEVQAKPLVASITPLVQREAAPEEEEVQTKPLPSTALRASVQREAAPEEEEVQTKPLIQREAAPEEEEIQTKPLPSTALRASVQREAAPEEEEIQTKPLLQRQADGSFEAGADIEQRLAVNKGSGIPLPPDLRAFMEPRFGADFGGVRVHTGGQAADLNRAVSAQAFTHGQDIYMGNGKYNPDSDTGKQLLAHELTHVIQQSGGNGRVQRWGDPPKMFAKKGPGTTHVKVTQDVFKGLEPRYRMWYSQEAQDHLAEKSEDIDKRAGFLVGSLIPGKIYGAVWSKWGSMSRGIKGAGRAIASGGRKMGRGLRRGLGWLGEKAGKVEGSVLEKAVMGKLGKPPRERKGFWAKLGGGIKDFGEAMGEGMLALGALPLYGLAKGTQWLGGKAGITKEQRQAKKEYAQEQYEESGLNIEQAKADEYDNLKTYWRSGSEAPNHGEGGKYKDDGAAADKKRVDEYIEKATAAWGSGDRRQSLQILAYALHAAEDRGAHGDGKPGTGHDPRKSTPPPPLATVTGYYNESNPDDGFDCDREGANAGGYAIAMNEGRYVLREFVKLIGVKTEEGEEKPMPEALSAGGGLAGFQKPGKFRRGIRGVGRFFGKDVIR